MYYPGSQEGIEKLKMEGCGCDDGSGSGGGHVGGRKGDGSAFCIHELVFSRRGVLVEMLAHRKVFPLHLSFIVQSNKSK